MKEYYKEALANDTNIWVSPNGNDEVNNGYFESPFRTIEAAVAAVTTSRKTIVLLPGEYTMTTATDITVNGTKIIGLGGVSVDATACLVYVFKTVFGAASVTKEFTLENVDIDHGHISGIAITNTSGTAKVNVYLNNVEFGASDVAHQSLDIDNVLTGQAIRVYANSCTFEGPVNMVTKNNGDRLRFNDCKLQGGLVTDTGAYTLEILLKNSIILHQGVTGGATQQTIYALYCMSETDADPNVYAALNTDDLAGSQSETVLFPAS
jgi:hypothetical protein